MNCYDGCKCRQVLDEKCNQSLYLWCYTCSTVFVNHDWTVSMDGFVMKIDWFECRQFWNDQGKESDLRNDTRCPKDAHLPCWQSNRHDLYRTAELVLPELGTIKILVNNADIVEGKLFPPHLTLFWVLSSTEAHSSRPRRAYTLITEEEPMEADQEKTKKDVNKNIKASNYYYNIKLSQTAPRPQ